MTDRELLWQVVRGVALSVTGFFAGAGAATSCAVRNLTTIGATDSLGGLYGLPTYLIFTALMIVWFVFACAFAWRNRNPSGYLLSAVTFTIFAFSVLNVVTTAYPACNAF